MIEPAPGGYASLKMRILLTTVHRPLGIDSDTCTENVQAEVFHGQVTRAQGVFSIGAIGTGWGLEFIAANLKQPTTVLHYPTKRRFLKELEKGYDYVGISFVIATFPKVVELSKLIRRRSPETKIIIGGYGTVIQECDQYADYVCREEGVNFLKRLFGEEEVDSFQIPVVRRTLSIMSVSTRPEYIIPVGLGCTRGCEFCCTSHFFGRKYIPLLRTGREIYDVMRSIDLDTGSSGKVGITDEDFLADKTRAMEMAELNSQHTENQILFSCFATLKSLSQYTIDELLDMGLCGVFVGVESKRATYDKLKGIDIGHMVSSLRSAGINVLISMIIGYDWHDEDAIEEDFQYLLSLKPTLTQFLLYSPCLNTPLYNRMLKERRIIDIPYRLHDGFHALFKHPFLSSQRLEEVIEELFRREYDELGPSICRILEVQLMGYSTLHDSPNPLFRARAQVHKSLCLEIYPLLKTAIRRAPSSKVYEYLVDMRRSVDERFSIPARARLTENVVPALALFTEIRKRLFGNAQPPTTVSRYRFH